ncbi:hypothetical protein [Arthrobacter sp. HS15c]|uniref:hypothetical protein n=1 Tax=Arthrobacter sp. HS15c TaxID=3230279 RepID=UPI0034678F49
MSGETQRMGVCAVLPDYRAAVAELPVTAALSESPRGSVVVVPGAGMWWDRALAARAEGAAALVIADPQDLPREAREVLRTLTGIPVIIERPRLRPDLVADAIQGRAGIPASIIAVECGAPASELSPVLRDGFGWARVFAGGPLSLLSGAATAQARVALLEPRERRAGPAVTVAGNVEAGHGPGGLLRILALGEVRSEVSVDQPAGLTRLETCTEEGGLVAPRRFEASARLALRRAFEACSTGEAVTDLEDFLDDCALGWGLAAFGTADQASV